jgi:hypothetical protein
LLDASSYYKQPLALKYTKINTVSRKRQRAGALQDASRVPNRSEFPQGLGLRRPSAAFPSSLHAFAPLRLGVLALNPFVPVVHPQIILWGRGDETDFNFGLAAADVSQLHPASQPVIQ